MSITLEELLIRLETRGGTQARNEIDRTGQSVRRAGTDAKAASSGFQASSFSLLDLASSAGTALSAVTAVAAFLAGISGLRTAAEFKDIELGLEAVIGNATVAKRLLQELKQLGKASPFDTKELSAFAIQMINAGTAVSRVKKELATITDLAAFARIPRAALPDYLRNLLQIRGSVRPDRVDLEELARRGPFGKIVGAGLGEKGSLTSAQAIQKLQGMTGEDAYKTILKGTEALAKGAAEISGMLSPINQFANLIENLNYVMQPTAELLLPVVQVVGKFVGDIVEALTSINELTGGIAGLVILVYALWRAKALLINTYFGAIGATNMLTAALQRYATAAGGAAAMSGAGPAGGFAGGFNPNARTGMLPFGGFRNAMRIGGIAGIAQWGKGVLGKVGGGPLALLGGLGLDMAGSAIGGPLGDLLKNVGSFGSIGAMIGSVIPGLGTLAGAGIGAAIGGLRTLYDHTIGKSNSDPGVEEQKKTNAILKEIKGHLIGGGPRAGAAATRTEMEIALARMMV